jgi:hypothetical protein
MIEDELIAFTDKEHLIVLIINSLCNVGLRIGATLSTYFAIIELLSLQYRVMPASGVFGASYVALMIMLVLCLIPDKEFVECKCYKCTHVESEEDEE